MYNGIPLIKYNYTYLIHGNVRKMRIKINMRRHKHTPSFRTHYHIISAVYLALRIALFNQRVIIVQRFVFGKETFVIRAV